ncbi:UNVERIFIED_CONTAM: hypothetical protein PYX00_011348 [Menopon gallinae]|uniref:Shelterin complex subunit TPP1/Est3 domain-containing protein n=1 Tax=Menopon gallinae TaxID=328185 RepID=A0AAW2H7D9_9NEOP
MSPASTLMSNFVREPWIHSLLSAQLYHNTVPSTSQRCQLIDVVGEADALEVIVSDRTHSITALLSRESTTSFKKIYALDWVDVKGCLMTLDRFYFEYSFEKNAFFIYTEDFSYFGSEGEIVGDPVSVNHVKDIREVLAHGMCGKLHICELDPLYATAADEADERRGAPGTLTGRCIGENAEKTVGGAGMASPQEQGSVPNSKTDGCTDVSGVPVCRVPAGLLDDETSSAAYGYGAEGENPPPTASAGMCADKQEDCIASSREPAPPVSERSSCEEDASVALPSAPCRSREKGVIDFQGRYAPSNFDLSIFVKRKRDRSPGCGRNTANNRPNNKSGYLYCMAQCLLEASNSTVSHADTGPWL